jgi:hypothetical protein
MIWRHFEKHAWRHRTLGGTSDGGRPHPGRKPLGCCRVGVWCFVGGVFQNMEAPNPWQNIGWLLALSWQEAARVLSGGSGWPLVFCWEAGGVQGAGRVAYPDLKKLEISD